MTKNQNLDSKQESSAKARIQVVNEVSLGFMKQSRGFWVVVSDDVIQCQVTSIYIHLISI